MDSLFSNMRRRKQDEKGAEDDEPMETEGEFACIINIAPPDRQSIVEQMEMIEKMKADNNRANKFFRVCCMSLLCYFSH